MFVFAVFTQLLIASCASAIVLRTSGRWIIDAATNKRVKLRCINWAGHLETNIPEGLNHQPVSTIAQWIASNNFNCVRLTFSIDMALNPNQPVSDSFRAAAGAAGVDQAALVAIYDQAVSKNPWLSTATVRSTFTKVIQELEASNILVILDNHVSKASWCCNLEDGNGWWSDASLYLPWNSRFFDTPKWLEGLRQMALFAANYPNVVGLALRNEIRAIPVLQDRNNHADWYDRVRRGASAVRSANPDLLVVVGGVWSATDLSYIRGNSLDPNRALFGDKLVWEFHNYEWSLPGSNVCLILKGLLEVNAGYLLEEGQEYTSPLWLSEFGWPQTDASQETMAYISCLVEYMQDKDIDWAHWALQGSYYVRQGTLNAEDSWGVLTADWSGWRNPAFVQTLGSMWQARLGPV